jgi:hypothetical protein
VREWLEPLIDSWPGRGGLLTALLSSIQALRWFRRRSPSRTTIFARWAEMRLSYPLLKQAQVIIALRDAEIVRLKATLMKSLTTSDSAALSVSSSDLEEATRITLNKRSRRRRGRTTRHSVAGPHRGSGSQKT